jgi:hypothetical protein
MKTVLTSLAAVTVLALTAATASADVTIYRGGTPETVATGGTKAVVLRGSGSLRSKAAPTAPQARYAHVTAGETLWLVDADGSKVTACSLQDSGYVGRRRIVCVQPR